jgi:peptidoglycan hydrolase CwlO-like protein
LNSSNTICYVTTHEDKKSVRIDAALDTDQIADLKVAISDRLEMLKVERAEFNMECAQLDADRSQLDADRSQLDADRSQLASDRAQHEAARAEFARQQLCNQQRIDAAAKENVRLIQTQLDALQHSMVGLRQSYDRQLAENASLHTTITQLQSIIARSIQNA